jgi:hypothetical protein
MDPAQVSKTEVFHRLLPDPWIGLCLVAMLGVICWGLFRLRAFWRDDADRDANAHEMLAQFRDSEREGVLTAEEYRLIKSRLSQRDRSATETERRDTAAKSTESAKGIAASPAAGGETQHPD